MAASPLPQPANALASARVNQVWIGGGTAATAAPRAGRAAKATQIIVEAENVLPGSASSQEISDMQAFSLARTLDALPAGAPVAAAGAPAWAVFLAAQVAALTAAQAAGFAAVNAGFAAVNARITALDAQMTARDANRAIARVNDANKRTDPQGPVLLKEVVRTGGPLPVGTVPVLPDAANGLHVEAAHIASWHGLSQLTGPELNVLFNIYQEPRFANNLPLSQRREGFQAFLLQ